VRVSFSGSLAVGKSTLAGLVRERLAGASLSAEDVGAHRFLAPFYQDRRRYAFHSRVEFLAEKTRQLRAPVSGTVALYDRSLPELITFARVLRRTRMLSDDEFILFRTLHDLLTESSPSIDAVVWVRCDPPVSLSRVAQRNRSFERDIDLAYLEALDAEYERWTVELRHTDVLQVDTGGHHNPDEKAQRVVEWLSKRADR
jgi:deoxyadenosine/deoxycytidine kinase